MIDRQTLMSGASRLTVAALLASLSLAGCQPAAQQAATPPPPPAPLAALPLVTTDALPVEAAPSTRNLAPAPPARVGRLADQSQRYAYADRAYALTSAFQGSPPDYMFDYGGGERPWVWRADDRSTRLAEPLSGGDQRYYYYDPDADTPYYVRDEDYGYGYDKGVLTVVYDRNGRALSPDYVSRQAGTAGQLLVRAIALYAASQRQHRQAVAQGNWDARRDKLDAERARQEAAQAANRDWQAYHDQRQQQDDAYWRDERARREAQAQRYAREDAQRAEQDRRDRDRFDAQARQDQIDRQARAEQQARQDQLDRQARDERQGRQNGGRDGRPGERNDRQDRDQRGPFDGNRNAPPPPPPLPPFRNDQTNRDNRPPSSFGQLVTKICCSSSF